MKYARTLFIALCLLLDYVPIQAGDALPQHIMRLIDTSSLVEGTNVVRVNEMTFTVLVRNGVAAKILKTLFNSAMRKDCDARMLDYVEEAYAYHLLGVVEHRFDDIGFENGSWRDLARVNDYTPCSIANENARTVVVTWNIDDKNVVMTFPIQYDKLYGGTRSQIEDRFIAGVKGFKPTRRRLPTISANDLNRMNENIMCLKGATYMNPDVNRNIYLTTDSIGYTRFVFSDAYPLATLANLMIVGSMEFQPMVNISVSRHKYGAVEKFSVQLEALIQYAIRHGCVPYWGIESYERGVLKGTLFLYNRDEGYDHVVRIECMASDIGKDHFVAKARASLYVPTNNVNNLNEEHNHISGNEKYRLR